MKKEKMSEALVRMSGKIEEYLIEQARTTSGGNINTSGRTLL